MNYWESEPVNQIILYISGPEVAEAVGRFMPELAVALRAEQVRLEAEYLRRGGVSGLVGVAEVIGGTSMEASAEHAVAETSAALRETEVVVEEVRVQKGRKPKPEPVKTEAEETCLDEPKPEPTGAESVKEADAAYTIDDLRRHLRAFGQANGADALATLYAEYGVKQLSELPADKYGEIIAKVS